MVTMEQIALMLDIVRNLEGMRVDMRANANAYKQQISDGVDPTTVAALIMADNAQYQRRLGWVKTLYNNHQTQMQSAVESLGCTLSSTIDKYQELKSCANATDAADLSDSTKIITRSDEILSEIAAHLTLW